MVAHKEISSKIREEARRLWILGDLTQEQIARILTEKHNVQITASRIGTMAAEEKWSELKDGAKVTSLQELGAAKKNQFLETSKKHLDLYSRLTDKTAKSLELDNPDAPLHFDSHLDGVKALQVSTEETMKIQKGVVSVELIQAIYEALVEEIQDEDTIARIGARFKRIAADYS